ncbi:MAG: hypothetical protein HGA96_05960 [Desulfobulbaceae bacterium]|nr:hypothetical protein [Desulfobulbaceae bacterium]
MGFDVFGTKPKNKNGEYFRNNVWYWYPLWDYIFSIGLLKNKEHRQGQYNNGLFIKNKKAKLISRSIFKHIQNGATDRYVNKYLTQRDSLPDERCSICNGRGTEAETDKICSCCDGKGLVPNHGRNNQITKENIEEFAKFCESSGGFQIC